MTANLLVRSTPVPPMRVPRRLFFALWLMGSLILMEGSLVSLWGQRTAHPLPSAAASATTSALTIGSSDELDVKVFDTPELSAIVRVSQNGVIALPVIGDVNVLGLTTSEANTIIEERLRDAQIMIDPHVTVRVTTYASQMISVVGEVRTPGSYLLLGPHSLYGALAAAGGVTKDQGATITVTHQDEPTHPVTINVDSPNYSQDQETTEVRPGDVVVVSRAASIFVLGDVNHSGEFLLHNGQPMSVLDALALAVGMTPTAKASQAAILRKTDDGTIRIPVDLSHISKNDVQFPLLQSADVLIIPRSGLKALVNAALPSVVGGVTSAATTAAILR